MAQEEMHKAYTVLDHLAAKVKFNVPEKALYAILVDRDIDPSSEYSYGYRDANRDRLRLALADTFRWFVRGESKRNNTSDADNGWSHSGGGYELDDDDKKRLISEANAIYSELEPSSVIKGRSQFRMVSFGVQRANYDAAGNPMPHIIS